MAVSRTLGQFAYGALFVVVLPGLWCLWALRLDRLIPTLSPIPVPEELGIAFAVAGLLLVAVSMAALWVFGKGLPMNAYPPSRLVSVGPYALFAHPIYLGFVISIAGFSIAAGSPAGLWIITPISLLCVIALVAGYEGPRLGIRFEQTHSTVFGLPSSDSTRATFSGRLAATAITLGPWAFAYALFSGLPAPVDALEWRMEWERSIVLQPWAVWIYSAAYPIAIAGPLALHKSVELRRFVISGWLVTTIGFTIMLLVPGRAELLPLADRSIEMAVLNANRFWDADWLALPSFHVAWAALAGFCLTTRFPRARIPSLVGVVLIAASCILTGSHAAADVIAGLALGVLCWNHQHVWLALIRCSARLANSWSAIRLGPFRIINHAIWSGLAAFSGMLVVVAMVGPDLLLEAFGIFLAGIAAAGAWGHALEGGNRLSRPFGYYGFLFGSVIAILILSFMNSQSAGILAAAFACGAPIAQAIGRVRCLVQGCCHGRPVVRLPGLVVTNPQSRITALSRLRGVPIHATQLYSILANLLMFALLTRLHLSGTPATLVGGMYLILSSLARFVEEEYRGEPQTPRIADLAIYQWIAIATFVTGILISMVESGPAIAVATLHAVDFLIPLGAGLVAAAFMSVDFPESRRRFSQLTVQIDPSTP